METTCERLEFVRKRKKKSYRELADLIGNVTGDTIRKAILRNRIKDRYVNALADKLDVDRQWIFTGLGRHPFCVNDEESEKSQQVAHLVNSRSTLESAYNWLMALKHSKEQTDDYLGAIIGYPSAAFSDALKQKTLTLDQIQAIAKHEGLLYAFGKDLGIHDSYEVSDTFESIEAAIAKEISSEVKASLLPILKRMEKQNALIAKFFLEVEQLKKVDQVFVPVDGQFYKNDVRFTSDHE